MTSQVRHIRSHLRANGPATALLVELERREALLARLRAHLPAPLARHCLQAAVTDCRLTVVVDSPAWVARVRLLGPELAEGLAERGQPIHDCEVKACPGPTASGPTASERGAGWRRGATSADSIRALETAASSMPSVELADSLRRLAATLRDQG